MDGSAKNRVRPLLVGEPAEEVDRGGVGGEKVVVVAWRESGKREINRRPVE